MIPSINDISNRNRFTANDSSVVHIGPNFNVHRSENPCLKNLFSRDPWAEKDRLKEEKGKLLPSSWRWILDNTSFIKWLSDEDAVSLWIKGDAGKGKTMLLCGIIDEVSPSTRALDPNSEIYLSCFFCQGTDERVNSATSVVRGLMWMLVQQQPSLRPRIQGPYNYAGNQLFKDKNSWTVLSRIFKDMLKDLGSRRTFLFVDAIDECTTDQNSLLDLLMELSTYRGVKLLITSRGHEHISRRLKTIDQLSLELNQASVSQAVRNYIKHRVDTLSVHLGLEQPEVVLIENHFLRNAEDTFLWVSLACKGVLTGEPQDALTIALEFPRGLEDLYHRMIMSIQERHRERSAPYFRILALAAIAHRPLSVIEYSHLSGNFSFMTGIINSCGSFLTIKDGVAYLVHQSARDFLVGKGMTIIFPDGIGRSHQHLFHQSMEIMTKKLHRDICSLRHPGTEVEEMQVRQRDTLIPVQYSCEYWVDHLLIAESYIDKLQVRDWDSVDRFLREKFLYWLEALSLLKNVSQALISLEKLQKSLQGQPIGSGLPDFVRDAQRFVMYFRLAIEKMPLQIYASGLVFSPKTSIIRKTFSKKERPRWVMSPTLPDRWTACLHTLESHMDIISPLMFLPELPSRLASGHDDGEIRVVDTTTGLLQTLDHGIGYPCNVAISPDGRWLSSSSVRHIKTWELETGQCVWTFEEKSNTMNCAIKALAAVAMPYTLASWQWALQNGRPCARFWDWATGKCIRSVEHPSLQSESGEIAFSANGHFLALSAAGLSRIEIWDLTSAPVLTRQVLRVPSAVDRLCFSPLGDSLAVSWRGEQQQSGFGVWKYSIVTSRPIWEQKVCVALNDLASTSAFAFSPVLPLLATAHRNSEHISFWHIETGTEDYRLEAIKGIEDLAFSPDGTQMASYSLFVKIWEFRKDIVQSSPFDVPRDIQSQRRTGIVGFASSHKGNQIAVLQEDWTVSLWNLKGGCIERKLCMAPSEYEVARREDIQLGFSPSDELLAMCDQTRLCIEDLKSSRRSHLTFDTLEEIPHSFGISNDGRSIAAASGPDTMTMWVWGGSQYAEPRSFQASSRFAHDWNWDWLCTNSAENQLDPKSAYHVDDFVETIKWKGKDVLWLPDEYRIDRVTTLVPKSSTVESNTIIQGSTLERENMSFFVLSNYIKELQYR